MTTSRRTPSFWPWLLLTVGLLWVVLVRVPLVLNAEAHLDSDLAVDGLTLLDAVEGRWRWHYPGTPHMGTIPVLLSWPQAKLWGANPITLVSGGVVAYVLVVLATFMLARRVFGPAVAAWSLVPLVFTSTGVIWLSGRITGGHLLTVAWHAGAFAGLAACLSKGGVVRAGLLGLWCGLGLYLDTMFLFTLASLVPAAVVGWWGSGRSRTVLVAVPVFLAGLLLGAVPREIGRWTDGHDAYQEQFQPIFESHVLGEHQRLLVLECLPRLIAGHRLPDYRMEMGAASRLGPADPVDQVITWTGLGLFAVALLAFLIDPGGPRDPVRRAVRWGLLCSSVGIVIAFIVNRNIFNSDNYRYLVFLIVPWALGYGLAMHALARRGRWATLGAVSISLLLVSAMSLDTVRWLLEHRWLGSDLVPTRQAVPSPTVLTIHPDATHVFGDYWDVYRMAFLSEGKLVGVPYPIYPNRFAGWSRGLGPGAGKIVHVGYHPRWRELLQAAWREDGRDPEALRAVTAVPWRIPIVEIGVPGLLPPGEQATESAPPNQ